MPVKAIEQTDATLEDKFTYVVIELHDYRMIYYLKTGLHSIAKESQKLCLCSIKAINRIIEKPEL